MRTHRLDTRIGGHPRYAYCHEWELMQIPPDILRCVCFVEVLKGSKWCLNGTAFFVSRPLEGVHPAVDPEPYAIYAVTAKHVLHLDGKTWDKDDPWWYDDARLVLNTCAGGTDYLPVPPTAWEPHPHSDTAVINVSDIDPAHFDFLHYPSKSYVDTDFFREHELTPGEEVIVMGLLWAHPGAPQITPIVRVGHVASFPVDDVNFDTGPEGAVLIEVLSFGGLSGSPAFLHLGDFRREDHGRGELLTLQGPVGPTGGNWLLGIVHGRFEQEDPARPHTEPLNTGITPVIPAARINELLDSDLMTNERADMAKKRNEEAPRTRRASLAPKTAETPEFDRFETLTRQLVNTPKPKPDAERKAD
jgi:hypothetical protein